MTTCSVCNASLGRSLASIFSKNDYPCENTDCQARLCKNCVGRHPLLLKPASGEDDVAAGVMKKYCKTCFQKESTIDFSKNYETIQGDSDIVWVFAHGASASRQMFVPHAKELKERFGHSSLLLDLPGHASQLETELTLESSKQHLESVLKECKSWTKSKKLVYVGGSLGAYVGIYLIDQLKEKFSGAVLMDCGQNVGPGASFKARTGLVVLKWIGRNSSNATMFNLMLGATTKSKADYHLIQTVFGAGMFFDQAEAHVECLKSVAPADHIPNIPFPILFMNGSEDHRDSEVKWLECCVDQKNSELKVYEGGDHFFMHDSRFVEDLFTRMEAFSKRL